ncbi:hypothetical protein GUJ93_ZPchr0007g4110 [Zizania palustris]|uniref:Uncharacterized protein n=1 Tax=Zizania palustris TaxID=103762 RepID=A0A8J5W4R7_ZIZPA|nr:hypothetical protein GUJ93_ZPchr0007g4110 [Zizania palustris]
MPIGVFCHAEENEYKKPVNQPTTKMWDSIAIVTCEFIIQNMIKSTEVPGQYLSREQHPKVVTTKKASGLGGISCNKRGSKNQLVWTSTKAISDAGLEIIFVYRWGFFGGDQRRTLTARRQQLVLSDMGCINAANMNNSVLDLLNG